MGEFCKKIFVFWFLQPCKTQIRRGMPHGLTYIHATGGKNMDKRMFQNKPVSLLGYGCMRFPTREENGERRIDRAEAEKLLDCAYAAGVNYYDLSLIHISEPTRPY